MHPISSEAPCDDVICQLDRLRRIVEPLAGVVTFSVVVLVIVSVIALVLLFVVANRSDPANVNTRNRRAVDGWMRAVNEAQYLVATADWSESADRERVRREALRYMIAAEASSALDETSVSLGAGLKVRKRIDAALVAESPENAVSLLRDARLLLRSWSNGDYPAVRRG